METKKFVEEEKECKVHGTTTHIQESNGYFRCKKCRSENVQRRRAKVKLEGIAYKGGKCSKCGYDKCPDALEFHHRDENSKDFGIAAKGFTRAWETVKEELDKCDLVCSNCHRELHYSSKIDR